MASPMELTWRFIHGQEAYYVALVELSLAIQKPLQEAAAFAGCICYLLDDISADAPGSATATPAE